MMWTDSALIIEGGRKERREEGRGGGRLESGERMEAEDNWDAGLVWRKVNSAEHKKK